MSDSYLSSTDATTRAAYLASAELAIDTQSIYSGMGLWLLAVGSIVMGLVMLKGFTGKLMGYLVVLAGVLSLFAPFGVFLPIPVIIPFAGLILTAIWQPIMGIRLFRLGSGTPREVT